MRSLQEIVLCFLWLMWFSVCEMYDFQRQAQRLDDLEIKLLIENKHQRADIFELRAKVAKLETFQNSYRDVKDRPESLEHEKQSDSSNTHSDSDSLEIFPNLYQNLIKGFKVEKALNARTRRHITEIDNELISLKKDTEKHGEEFEQVKSILNRIDIATNETAAVNKALINQIQKMPQITDAINDVGTLLDNYMQSIYRPKSCSELLRRGHASSGLYKVYPGTWTEGIQVFCDQDSDGGGWTVFQRREDGFLDFYRGWLDYKQGFGSLLGEFWLGNENIHHLTAECCHELRIELTDFNGNQRYAKYSNFKVGPKSGDYVVTVNGHRGDAGDSLGGHNGASFSTKDYGKSTSCSLSYKGGWWYTSCHGANLNGLYLRGNHTSYADGIEWKTWTGYNYSLKFVEMKFRERV